MAASFTSGLAFSDYGQRIDLGIAAISELGKLELWWASLPLDERLLSKNKDHLILQSEQVIMNEVVANFGMVNKPGNH